MENRGRRREKPEQKKDRSAEIEKSWKRSQNFSIISERRTSAEKTGMPQQASVSETVDRSSKDSSKVEEKVQSKNISENIVSDVEKKELIEDISVERQTPTQDLENPSPQGFLKFFGKKSNDGNKGKPENASDNQRLRLTEKGTIEKIEASEKRIVENIVLSDKVLDDLEELDLHCKEKTSISVKEMLLMSDEGRKALSIHDKYMPNLTMNVNFGSFFRKEANEVSIDYHDTKSNTIFTYVHEMHHLRCRNNSDRVDALDYPPDEHHGLQNRENFITAGLNEEAEAQLRSILAKDEMMIGHPEIYFDEYLPLEKTFWRAVSQKEDELMEDGKLSEEDKQKQARQFGKEAMVQALRDGKEYIPETGNFVKVFGSTTGKPYTEIYGEMWDKQYK